MPSWANYAQAVRSGTSPSPSPVLALLERERSIAKVKPLPEKKPTRAMAIELDGIWAARRAALLLHVFGCGSTKPMQFIRLEPLLHVMQPSLHQLNRHFNLQFSKSYSAILA